MRVGKPEDVIPELGACQVLAQAEVCTEETSVERKLKHKLGSGAPLTLLWGACVLGALLPPIT